MTESNPPSQAPEASNKSGSPVPESAPSEEGLAAASDSSIVLDAPHINRALTRIAHEVLEQNRGAADLVVLGIPTRGVGLAQRLALRISQVEGVEVLAGALDTTMYRDDLRQQPIRALERTDLPVGGIDGKTVILVDDVLYSGRTVRAALDALAAVGRPRVVRLAVLVDRGHRELPIRADHVGKNLPTAQTERVQVLLTDPDGRDEVRIIRTGRVG
jgi:pyrimidine operon attenuation protein / uracil phosphoribosyltransferase